MFDLVVTICLDVSLVVYSIIKWRWHEDDKFDDHKS